jgi:hypothetical protein
MTAGETGGSKSNCGNCFRRITKLAGSEITTLTMCACEVSADDALCYMLNPPIRSNLLRSIAVFTLKSIFMCCVVPAGSSDGVPSAVYNHTQC